MHTRDEVVDPSTLEVLEGVVVPTEVSINAKVLQKGLNQVLQLGRIPMLAPRVHGIVPRNDDPLCRGRIQCRSKPFHLELCHHAPLVGQ